MAIKKIMAQFVCQPTIEGGEKFLYAFNLYDTGEVTIQYSLNTIFSPVRWETITREQFKTNFPEVPIDIYFEEINCSVG